MKIVSESGLYSLILRSRKPEAKAFKHWVTHEVLAAIRKTGGYTETETAAEASNVLSFIGSRSKENDMNEIMPIIQSTVNEETVNTVNARDLHRGLGVGKDFSTWVKNRIGQCDLMEGVDFIKFPKMGESDSKPLFEYHLTLDAAKHLAMLERNERGKLVRQYFIDFEKKAREVLPKQTFEEMTLAVLNGLQAKIAEQAPEIEFFENYMESNKLSRFEVLGKLFGMSAQAFCALLREDGYLFRAPQWKARPGDKPAPFKNLPIAKYVDKGYFVVKKWSDTYTDKETGEERPISGNQTRVTPAGKKFFIEVH